MGVFARRQRRGDVCGPGLRSCRSPSTAVASEITQEDALSGPPASGTIRQIFTTSPAVAPSCGCAPRCRSRSADTLYLVDSHPIELCDLLSRHPVVRQSADATELGGRDLPLGGCLSPYLLRLRSRFDLRCIHRHHRRDREDTWLPSRLMLG